MERGLSRAGRCSLQPQVLSRASPAALLNKRVTLHPSVRIVRSAYPVADIWAAHQKPGVAPAVTHWCDQDVLIVRPDSEVQVHTLGRGVYAFVGALLDGMCVQDAAEVALGDHVEFDAGQSIVKLLRHRRRRCDRGRRRTGDLNVNVATESPAPSL